MRFHFETKVPSPLDAVFAFHRSARRLELLHGGWPRLRLLACEPLVRLGGETWIEISFSPLTPLALGFRHTLFVPPFRFGERLIHGPFSVFTHEHQFLVVPGGTLVRDLVEVRLPLYYGGEPIVRRAVAPCLARMFAGRAVRLGQLARDGFLPPFRNEHPMERRVAVN